MITFNYCPVCGSRHFEPSSVKSRKCKDCGFEYFINPSSAYVAFIMDRCGRLLVVRRGREPAFGTLDLPGGFADMDETAEEGIAREVLEETGLVVTSAHYLFSIPNTYVYSGLSIPTLDMFFKCEVADITTLKAADDAAECMWIAPEDLHPNDFGLNSIRKGVMKFMALY